MTENEDYNSNEFDNNVAEIEPKVLESCEKVLLNDELSAKLLKEADDFENYAIEAFKNGTISLDQYHQSKRLAPPPILNFHPVI